MMKHNAIQTAYPIAAGAWGVAIVDLTPLLDLPANGLLFTIAVACVSAYAIIGQLNARPADEVYLVGKAMGRMEAEEEARSGVTRLPERRLRVVDGS